jgi:hypothetical protein
VIRTAGAVATGVASALRVPLRLRGASLRPLLTAPPTPLEAGPEPVLALRAARLALRLLALVPASPWRNTCLYRSVAECLVLRAHGTPAVLRIGVRSLHPPDGPVEAHAWVERTPPSSATSRHPPGTGGYQPLKHGAPR